MLHSHLEDLHFAGAVVCLRLVICVTVMRVALRSNDELHRLPTLETGCGWSAGIHREFHLHLRYRSLARRGAEHISKGRSGSSDRRPGRRTERLKDSAIARSSATGSDSSPPSFSSFPRFADSRSASSIGPVNLPTTGTRFAAMFSARLSSKPSPRALYTFCAVFDPRAIPSDVAESAR